MRRKRKKDRSQKTRVVKGVVYSLDDLDRQRKAAITRGQRYELRYVSSQ